MPPSSGELWGYPIMPNTIVVDCLLPTGIIIPLSCSRDATLESIKEDLWENAQKYPLYRHLGEPSSYIFVSITRDGDKEEFYDEYRRLCDLHLFQPILKVVEPKGNTEEKKLNSEIRLAVGGCAHEFDNMKDSEVIDFRRNILSVCKDAVDTRNTGSEECRASYVYPPEIESSEELPANLERKLDKGLVMVCVWGLSDSGEKQKHTLEVHKDTVPEAVIREAILKKLKCSRLSREEQVALAQEHQHNYLLKVCGVNQYLLKSYPLCRYKYIRMCIAKGEIPQLMLMLKDAVYKAIPPSSYVTPSYVRRNPSISATQPTVSLYKVDESFRVKILGASYVNVKDVDKIYVRVGIYHGTESLCPFRDTEHVSHSNPKWDELLEFQMYIPDIPRSARLCVSICAVSQRKKREERCAIAWGNVSLFDYKSVLLSGRVNLHLWPVPKGMDELLNPLGSTGSNPNREAPCLVIELDRFSGQVVFPSMEQIEEYASFVSPLESTGEESPENWTDNDKDQIHEIIKRDPLSEISEQEKMLLWRMRYYCYTVPNSLPKLLDASKWNSRDHVAQLYRLLKKWKRVSPETALELLDCKYADMFVRKYAVEWLDGLSDELLSQYLLQLVQVLKYEPYLENDLGKFLIRRSLLNYNIGHFFFWHLKSEMHDPSVAVRFGLLLEGFCRGIGTHLKSVVRQVGALEKLTQLTDSLKERKDDTPKERLKFLIEQFSKPDFLEALQHFPSPLNNSCILGDLIVNECRILDSAKKPLWLLWKNPDHLAEQILDHHEIIFKNGDDLRQDMLTLQVIRIMDSIWQKEGLDLRMMPYACLSTGKHVGMIEVVRNAKTVMNIQKKGGRMAAFQVDSTQLHKWIRDKNKGDRYKQAIETFTLSCAGYCVATFILGIGDRNPDNIMVNEEGQIFHIDFGHFLGHFKKKFGINRERVPFVLTEDFLHVIARGQENPRKSKEFQSFQELCGKAYLLLHRHANLLITLFTMMLSTGIPELQSIDDIGYLRKTLQVEKPEEQALEYFQNQFFEAYGGAWTTKVDWFFHSVKHF
ncbi:phosphatidylinositol 4,5-bisphosphate 3-kinase catalytic subunit alpha isoform-like [Dermacentor andersoni]|uniref:phosphatidylinositol 4,5-bisphosphate 3-kinase catalytic subunit alpha isoform-like n=1 Tax=Dermacentor andersoni TaxID=34620 RepID=UPI002417FA56|nr:phosphatidylinositol 4,5-bisphosphate 3-kinase catalytic subunit alpha isoform-like isoform X2 [Dermacentor andersoni]